MLNRIEHGPVLELNLARPPANALNEALLLALAEALRNAPEQGFGAIVLSGQAGMFSAGMDVVDLLARDRAGVMGSWQAFFSVCQLLATSPLPVAAAITGHSPAGGAVLAIHCDYRVMAEGKFKIGLNEVAVGLFVPALIQRVLSRLVGAHRAERLLVAGAMVGPGVAQQYGLIDELAPPEAVTDRAVEFCKGLLALPKEAMRTTRNIARADLADWYQDSAGLIDARFLDRFMAEESQQTLHALVAQLKARG